MVRSWIPAFLMPCSFQSLIPAFLMSFSCHSFPFKNLQLWTLDGKIVHSNLFPSIFLPSFLFKQLREWTLDGKISYSDFSHALFLSNTVSIQKPSIMNFGCSILDSYFSILFSSPFPFAAFFSKTCKTELWMVRSWIPSFLIPFSFRCFFSKTCNFNFGW